MVKALIPPTEKQVKILRSLSLKGPGNIQQIQLREGMNYPTAHRNVKYLEGRGLIWMSGIGDRGPKSPKIYSLTPFGLLYSVIMCGLITQTKRVTGLWGEATPLFIKYRGRFEELGLWGEYVRAAIKVYDDLVPMQSMINLFPERGNLITMYRNTLDQHFLSVICGDHTAAKLSEMVEIIRDDPEYLDIWRRFYGVERLKADFLETLNGKIVSNSNNRHM